LEDFEIEKIDEKKEEQVFHMREKENWRPKMGKR